jgi:tetratricopeptide (TPR) repeat protein
MPLLTRFQLILTTAVLLLAVQPLRAGLYNTAVPAASPTPDLLKFTNDQLPEVRALAPPDPLTGSKPSAARLDYLQKVAKLREKQAAGRLSAEESANLGAYLVRLRRTRDGIQDLQEAVEVLETARREHPRDFQVLANLGTAYQITGRLDAAESCLQDAEALAPKEHRTIERYHLLLVRQRLREQITPGLAPLDQLFVGPDRAPIRFVGEKGQWAVGELAGSETKRLPGGSLTEATAIVQQLLLWLPDDARLHWQLGELANAKRDFKAAARAMEAAVYDFRLSTPDLRRRRALLQEPAAWQAFFERVGGADKQRAEEKQRAWLSQALAAGFQGAAAPDIGQQMIWQWRLAPKPDSGLDAIAETEATAPAESSALAALSKLGWRGWTIIAAGGVLIVVLACLQLRQMRRRRTQQA